MGVGGVGGRTRPEAPEPQSRYSGKGGSRSSESLLGVTAILLGAVGLYPGRKDVKWASVITPA